NTVVSGLLKVSGKLKVQTGDGRTLEADVIVLSAGVRPDTTLAEKAGLKLGPAKGIQVNEYLQTSDENIYAVGDAIEFANPISGQSTITTLAGPANKQGRICANNIVLGNKHIYKGSINTAIIRLFDLTIGVAGLAAKDLERAGIEHVVSTIHGNSHAGYFPGAKLMTIQIAFSRTTGNFSVHR
ncbi:MAG TPA: FAD-dependent oxidoreductase, partial [Chryseosolibacter sp.]